MQCATQNHTASRACFVSGSSTIFQIETSKSGIASNWRIASERKPPRVPPPRMRPATTAKAHR